MIVRINITIFKGKRFGSCISLTPQMTKYSIVSLGPAWFIQKEYELRLSGLDYYLSHCHSQIKLAFTTVIMIGDFDW